MAFSQVQTTTTNYSGTGTTLAATISAATQNNLLVVHITIVGGPDETCSGVTDDKGNTYVLQGPYDQSDLRAYQAYGVQTTSGATSITATFSSNVRTKRIRVDEFSGGATTNASVFDSTKTDGGSGTSLALGAGNELTPAATGELISVTLAANSGATANWTAGTNYTLYSGTGSTYLRSEYRLSGTTSETTPATVDATNTWKLVSTAFKPASGSSSSSSSCRSSSSSSCSSSSSSSCRSSSSSSSSKSSSSSSCRSSSSSSSSISSSSSSSSSSKSSSSSSSSCRSSSSSSSSRSSSSSSKSSSSSSSSCRSSSSSSNSSSCSSSSQSWTMEKPGAIVKVSSTITYLMGVT